MASSSSVISPVGFTFPSHRLGLASWTATIHFQILRYFSGVKLDHAIQQLFQFLVNAVAWIQVIDPRLALVFAINDASQFEPFQLASASAARSKCQLGQPLACIRRMGKSCGTPSISRSVKIRLDYALIEPTIPDREI